MMIDKLVLSVFLLLLCAAVTVQSILLIVPFVRRMEYDAICHDYIMRMEHLGGLPAAQQQALLDRLSERGFHVRQMVICETGSYGNPMRFEVQASWQGHRLTGWLQYRKVDYRMTCTRDLLCRVPAAQG